MTIVPDHIIYPPDQTDFAAIALRLVNTGADAFYGAGTITAAAAILKEVRNLGSDMVYVMPGGQSAFTLANVAGPDAAYNALTLGYVPGAEGNTQIFEDLYAKYKDMFGAEDASTFNGNYPSTLYSLLSVMSIAKSTDVQTVMSTWTAQDKIDTLYGMGPTGGAQIYGLPNHVVTYPAGISVLTKDGVKFEGFIDTYLP